MSKKNTLIFIIILFGYTAFSQNVGSTPEYIKPITSLKQGERLPDGRLKKVPIEAAWSVLRNRDYESQFEGSWTVLFPENAMTGQV